MITTRIALASVTLILGGALGGQAALTHAASSKSSASALVDSFNGSGELIKARSTAHGVHGLSVQWKRGVSIKIPRLGQNTKLAAYTLVTDPNKPQIMGTLSASKAYRAKASSVVLKSGSGSGVTVKLTAGSSRPRLDITGLPAGVTSLQLTTIGKGRAIIRLSAPCSGKRRRTSAALTLRPGDRTSAQTIRSSSAVVC